MTDKIKFLVESYSENTHELHCRNLKNNRMYTVNPFVTCAIEQPENATNEECASIGWSLVGKVFETERNPDYLKTYIPNEFKENKYAR